MKILLVHTGGTIGTAQGENREQSSDTVNKAKKYLISAFENSRSAYADDVEIVDAKFPEHETTLSESMTLEKLGEIVLWVRDRICVGEEYSGVVVLHGTDTLAYTASLFAFVFASIKVPMFLVSGNRPPRDPASNATANFISAIELICEGIAPNVYVTYRNSDGKMRLFLASSIMQCANFSEDLLSASSHKVFELEDGRLRRMFVLCHQYSQARACEPLTDIMKLERFSDRVLLIRPYTGLDYSVYRHCFEASSGHSYRGVVHGTYHSGTVAWQGLVLAKEAKKCRENNDPEKAKKYQDMSDNEAHSVQSVYHLASICSKFKIPLYIAPCVLGGDQYETMPAVNKFFEDSKQTAALLNMTTEAAYAKLVVALTFGMNDEQIARYMKTPINNEFI